MKRSYETQNAPAPIGPYSQAIQFGNTLVMSGQVAINPATGEMENESIESETRQVMHNIEAVLMAAGLGLTHVVKCSIFLKDMEDFSVVNGIYSQYFNEPYPARETVEVARLPKDARVEISVTAYMQNE